MSNLMSNLISYIGEDVDQRNNDIHQVKEDALAKAMQKMKKKEK